MSPEQVNKFLSDIHDIKVAVVGNEKLGQPGLIKRTERLEKFAFILLILFAGLVGIPNLISLLKFL